MSSVCLQQLIKHIDNSPFGWSNGLQDGKILVHKDTTQEQILSWLKKLDQLSKYVKEQELSLLDIRNRAKITRTM